MTGSTSTSSLTGSTNASSSPSRWSESATELLKYTFHSTMTIHFSGQYTWDPFDLSSYLTPMPSLTHPPSFVEALFQTHIQQPHSCKFHRLGFLPVAALSGVRLSKAFVEVQFFNQMAWCAALPQRNLGCLLECSMALTFLRMVQLRCSVMLCCSVSWMVSF